LPPVLALDIRILGVLSAKIKGLLMPMPPACL
jgi:hypothetical protein